MSSPEHKEKIWNIIKELKVGMLVTEDGSDLRARPMHLVQDDYDGTIWFFSDKDSAKVYDIKGGHHVCLTFCDHDEGIHVSLSGVAEIDHNKELIDKFWNPFVDVWFPEGKNDPNLTLIKINIKSGEHWDSEDNKILQFAELVKAKATGEKPDMGEHEKFG